MSKGKPVPILLIGIFGLFVLAMAGAFVSASGAFSSHAPTEATNVADLSTATPTSPPPTPTPTPAGPPSFAQTRLWVGGDSLAAYLCETLVPDIRAKGAVADEQWTISSGLSRPDFFDWITALQKAIETDHPNVMVFMAGANDAQGLTTSSGQAVSITPFDDTWTTEYTKRVGQAMDILSGDGRLAIWVGMPVMQVPSFDSSMQKLNAIYKAEAAKHPRVIYVDSSAVLAPGGAFALDLPGPDGTPVRVRAEDGVHLTSAGGELLAQDVLKTLEATMPGGQQTPAGH